MKKSKLKKEYHFLFFNLLLLTLSIIALGIHLMTPITANNTTKKSYTSNVDEPIILFDNKLKEIDKIYRGQEVDVYNDKIKDKNNNNYVKIKHAGRIFYINDIYLTTKRREVIKEEKMYVRTPAIVYKTLNDGMIISQTKKGDELQILDYDEVDNKGKVNAYKIKIGDVEGYAYQKYLLPNQADALQNYDPTKYYEVHSKRGNTLGGGSASNLDYYPVSKPTFENNIMPKKIYALYLNDGHDTISNVDAFIEYAKTTKINAFVVDIKDNQAPGYKSKVFEAFSPTNYQHANNSLESYKAAIAKIKAAGFYVIGRITVFKDKYYCNDHPENSIMDVSTGKPYLHSDTYWPSPYQRPVWEFNVNLAKEAVTQMGFNEIQFDYARFPDRVGDAEKKGLMDFRNTYNEEKAQAIQRFLMYATDELHKLKVYVSVDVFGESAYTYVTAYGQYWAAISNVVDVISGMPYPDHFNKYEFGFKEPVWTTPYELLYHWGTKYVMQRQSEIPTPAITRTWIEVYDAKGGSYPYGVKEIDAEIRGLFDAGLTGGYMTWLSYSSLDRYKSQKEIYDREY